MIDTRTIEHIEYGEATADRVSDLTPDLRSVLHTRFIAFDTETTGFDPEKDRIIEVGAVLFEGGKPVSTFQSLVNADVPIPPEASAVNHITDEMLADAPDEMTVYKQLVAFLGAEIICGHVAGFDMSFLCYTLSRIGLSGSFRFVDTREQALGIHTLGKRSLKDVAEYFGVEQKDAHRAADDAKVSGEILCRMMSGFRSSPNHPVVRPCHPQ